MRAVKKLKNGRAAGCDDIPPELKCALPHVAQAMYSLFQRVWCSWHVQKRVFNMAAIRHFELAKFLYIVM